MKHPVGRVLGLLFLSLFLVQPSGSQGKDPRRTEAELKAVKAEIERIRAQVSKDQVERSRLAKELRTAEVSVSSARAGLDRLRKERAERNARRAELSREKQETEAKLAQERAALAGQLRAAYLIGREEPLKLLLNQKDPARAGRMFAYYSYFGRSRAVQIGHIEEQVTRIDELDEELAAEEQKLADLETERRAEVARLEGARKERRGVLASLEAESASRAQALEKLRSQQSGLEKLLKELRRAIEKFPPVDGKDAFAKLRGRLAWPASGSLLAKFGQSRAGTMKWDGVLIGAERGSPVRAVYHGRVIYADWLPGLGLLTIVDHGEGYLSLYGHNERLFKAVGERVAAGDSIATVGDSGGTNRPQLYFEIRKGGRPVNPQPWFKSSVPP